METQANYLSSVQGFGKLSPVRQLVLLVALAGSVAVGVGVAMWSQTPNYSLLYGSLAGKDASEVVEALQKADIPFRLERETGAILVPSGQIHDARLKLASAGLPRGTDIGLEMLHQEQGFGTSQFVEQARYRRALEVELSRSISRFNNIESARVHLAMPKQSVFVRGRRGPSASVLLRLYPGRSLEEGQADAISHLVAAAVPNMEPGEVRVIDDKGRLLTAKNGDDRFAMSRKEFEHTHNLEEGYIRRIETILEPFVGIGGAKAQVTADVDFTATEESRETYTPDGGVIRSEQVLEENGSGASSGSGVPGALSNQPPGGASAPETAGAGGRSGSAASSDNSRRRSTRNYELDRTISHVRRPYGSIRRLSVAVVVDDRREIDEDGDEIQESREPEELERITALVKEAVGYDEKRGDSVNVINAPFVRPAEPEPLPDPPIWEQPWVWDLARQIGGGLLVILMIFGVFRPLMKNLTSRDESEKKLQQALAEAREALENGGGEQARLTGGAAQNGQSPYENNLDNVRSVVSGDPKRAANVVRSWVGEGG